MGTEPSTLTAPPKTPRGRAKVIHSVTCFIDTERPAVVRVIRGQERTFLSVDLGADISVLSDPKQSDAALVAWLEAVASAARKALDTV